MKASLEGTAKTGHHTWSEILQQPMLWPVTSEKIAQAVEQLQLRPMLAQARVLLTGAGTSAYAARAIATNWPYAVAVPSTDLLIDTERHLTDVDVVVSIGRSGNSPESIATVKRIHQLQPSIQQIAITCNAEGELATSPILRSIVLDPRTNDQSLVMTSSFSNLVVAGLCLAHHSAMEAVLSTACSNAQRYLDVIQQSAQRVARRIEDRILLLSSSPLFPWAQEGALKALEMTSGKFPVLAETYLGLRHGPMSFVRPNTVILCLLSNDLLRRRYELDLIKELRAKELGHLVGIGVAQSESSLFEEAWPAILPNANDVLRTPFEILGPQMLGYYLSLNAGLNPDNPSPDGVINRVVQGVTIYEDTEN